MKESELYKPIIQYLAYRGIPAWRNNSGAVISEYKGKKRMIRYGFPGAADIIGIVPGGRWLAIEVKLPGNRPTPEQERFLGMIKDYDGIAFIATSIQDVERELEGLI